jgi:hypothetical protein
MSNGDVHIVQIDGNDYDFQAVGEYVLLRSADGSVEIQGRLEPYEDSDAVSINTAVALRAGAQRLTVHQDRATWELRAAVDGRRAAPDAPTVLDDGTRLVPDGAGGFRIELPDGTFVYVIAAGVRGLNAMVEPSQALLASASGLMAPGVGGLSLPVLPDGRPVEADAFDRDGYHRAFYETLAAGWRVTAETSLFDYEPGETTDTFTIPGFPAPEKVLTLDDLTPEQRAAGEAACRHILATILRDQCIFDVAITGDPAFAQIYDFTATLIETGALPRSREWARVVNLYAGENGPVALDVYAWSNDGAALVATVPYGAASPWFDPATVTEGLVTPNLRISMQVQGEALNEYGLNLVDVARDNRAWTQATIAVGPGDPARFNWTGHLEAVLAFRYEALPGGFAIDPAPPGDALIAVDSFGLEYTLPTVRYFASVGDGCLSDPDFPGLSRLLGPWLSTGPGLLRAPAGQHELTFHAGSPQDDAFAVRCDSPPALPPVALDLHPGERVFVFLYAADGEREPRTLVLPMGGATNR